MGGLDCVRRHGSLSAMRETVEHILERARQKAVDAEPLSGARDIQRIAATRRAAGLPVDATLRAFESGATRLAG